ncbi:MAG: hypothetical protein ABIZ80_12165 [Bryobacteraceae bacterium]
MSPTEMKPEDASAASPASTPARPFLVVPPAGAEDVMREQLDFLIEHSAPQNCGCGICQRYLRARSVLLDLFTDAA